MRRAAGQLAATVAGLVALVSALLPGTVGTSLGETAGAARGAAGAAPVAGCGTWEIVPAANHGSSSTSLSGVDAVSSDDVWAVGSWTDDGVVYHPMAEHWDGDSWMAVPAASAGTGSQALFGVGAVSSDDVWAVGLRTGASTFRTLIEHWDGGGWSVVPSPNSGTGENVLVAVTAVTRDDVWAVGYAAAASGSPRRTLIEHWDGGGWSVVPSPSVGPGESFLWSVDAVSASNVWAVGQRDRQVGIASLIEHWNGSVWSTVASPAATQGDILQGVAAPGAHAIMAVGRGLTSGNRIKALAEAYHGSAWSLVPIPNGGTELNWLFSVAASSAGDAWAVGERRDGFGMPYRTLVEHWNGTRWRVVNAPNRTLLDNVLSSVAHVPGTTEYWAVGSYLRSGTDRSLIEHRC